MNLLSNDSILGKTFNFLGHLILLNILWILCCIPIVTIGPSTAALYYSVLKMHKGNDSSAAKDFFHSFRQNFRQAAISGVFLTIIGILLYLEYTFLSHTKGFTARLLSLGITALSVIWFILVVYLFPIISAFSNTLKNLTIHVFYFAFRHILLLISILAINFLPMYFTLNDTAFLPFYLFFWLSVGFSLTAYASSYFFYKIFKPHLEKNKNS